jgi:hypothetical protein
MVAVKLRKLLDSMRNLLVLQNWEILIIPPLIKLADQVNITFDAI